MRKGGSDTTPTYKGKVLTSLNASYDIRLFFDDLKKNLMAAAAVGIPGLYQSISDYTKLLGKSNPYQAASADDFFPGPARGTIPHYMTSQTIPVKMPEPQTFQPDLEEMEQRVSDFKKMEVEWFGEDPEEIEEEYQPDEAALQEMREDDAALHKLDARGNPPVKPRRRNEERQVP